MTKQPPYLLGLLFLLLAGPRIFADQLPAKLDLKTLPVSVIEEVIVPNPDEVFSLMDKLPGHPDWASKVRREFQIKKTSDRTNLALIFGTLIADGFIAVQAEDAEAVQNAGREILALAKNLGLEQAVVPHCHAILDACQQRKWDQVRGEFDLTHQTVRDTMKQMRDEQLAKCVSVSGWVRGTQVLTGLIGDGYSPEKAEILHQPDLAAHFVKQLESMDAKTAGSPAMKAVLSGLREVSRLMAENQEVSPRSVTRIHAICAEVLAAIQPKEPR